MGTRTNEARSMKLCSYNIAGFNQCDFGFVQQLVDTHDFVFLQELWLHTSEGHRITDSLNNAAMHFVSGMPDNSLCVGRKYGGCCILWPPNLACRVSPLPSDNRRLCAVRVEVSGSPLLLVNVYMPCDTDFDVENLNSFNAVLNDIACLADTENINQIVLGGDLNTDFSRHHSLHTAALLRFTVEENISLLNALPCYDVDYTYESMAHGTRSTLDHFLVSNQLVPHVTQVKALHSALSSDHSPVEMTVSVNVSSLQEPAPGRRNPKPLWHKASDAQIEQYRDRLDALVATLDPPHEALRCRAPDCAYHSQEINAFYRSLVDACITAGKECIPHSRPQTSKKNVIPLWTPLVKPLREQAMFWQGIWKSCGSPTTGTVALIRRRTRSRYHRMIRHLKNNEQLARFSVMGEDFVRGGHGDFWTEVKKMRGGDSIASYTIGEETTEPSIAELFREKYSSLYSSVGFNAEQMQLLREEVDHNARAHHDCPSHLITFTELFQCMKALKPGKHDGYLGTYSDHLRHAPHRFACCLLLVFNSLLTHGMVPEEMCLSTVSPIPKNKRKSLSDPENYRAIALSSVMGKLLDRVFLLKCPSLSKTSDMQFGFKKGHGTLHCSFVVREVLDYYTSRGSDVYIALLDASKAFDRVEFTALFRRLISQGVCPIVTRLLLRLYTRQMIRVRWGEAVTDGFLATNGVKQGGVLSPSLFTLYIDPLLRRLSNAGIGCHMGNVFCAGLGYADDVILMSPSRMSLKRQLHLCATYAEEFNVAFNPAKSKIILVPSKSSPRPNEDSFQEISFMGAAIDFVPADRHLGCLIGNTSAEEIIDGAISDFSKRAAMLRSHFFWLLPQAKYSLFKSYCMPLYGCALWDYSHPSIAKFCIAWRKVIRSIHGLHPRTHCTLLPAICDDVDVFTQLLRRLLGFAKCLANAPNSIVQQCLAVALQGSRSAFGRSLSVLCSRLGCSRDGLLAADIARITPGQPDTERDRVEGGLIRDLLNVRHDIVVRKSNDFCFNDIQYLLNDVCTH